MKSDPCVTSEVILPGLIAPTIESDNLAHAWAVAEYYSHYKKRVHPIPDLNADLVPLQKNVLLKSYEEIQNDTNRISF